MKLATTAADFLPERADLRSLADAADSCQGCELFEDATQTVFGAGPACAKVIFVGEMPGDQEDRRGEPFVGPAGRLLDEALDEAGIARDDVYVTNAVKHFRWEPRGKMRLHKSPSARHVEACKPWLQAEILAIEPMMIVCLGAVAAKALLGASFRITKQRGELLATREGVPVLATHHPAGVLRAPASEDRAQKRDELVADLQTVAAAMKKFKRKSPAASPARGTRRRPRK